MVLRLLAPFAFWNAIANTIALIYAYIISKEDLPLVIGNLIKIPFGGGAQGLMDIGISVFPSWFLTALFCSSILFLLIDRVEKRTYRWLILSILTILGIFVFSVEKKIPTPYRIDIALVCIPFTILGFKYNSIKRHINRPIWGIIFVIIGTLCNILNLQTGITSIEIVCKVIGNPIFFYLSALSLCFGCTLLFETILRESTIGEYFGKNSMTIMFLHWPLICLVRRIIEIDLFTQFVIVCAFLYVTCEFVNKFIPWTMNFNLLLKKK